MKTRRRIRYEGFVLAAALAACEDPVAPAPTLEEARYRAGAPAVDVLTWNVYVGADIEAVLTAQDVAQVPVLVAQAWQAIQETDFAERAEAIADQIASRRPHAIGLQEVSLFRLQGESDFFSPDGRPASEVALDYLALLQDALQARGLAYDVAALSENFDIEVPMLVGFEGGIPQLADIRLTDSDVILVRSDVPHDDATTHRFETNLVLELGDPAAGGVTFEVARGFAAVDIRVKGIDYRVVTTHLEPADPGGVVNPQLEQLQLAQAGELLEQLAGEGGRVILTGDLNSAADGPGTRATYERFLASGFVDAWSVGRPRGPGFTSNQSADLRNESSELFHRIDFVLYRDAATSGDGRFRGSLEAERVGEEREDRTASGLWPSDHAGVAATLRPAVGPAIASR